MHNQPNILGLLFLGILLIMASLGSVFLAWQLLRAWRRHESKTQYQTPRRVASDIWQASGDRLVTRLNRPRPWNRPNPPQNQ